MRRFIPHISGLVVLAIAGAFFLGAHHNKTSQSLLGGVESSLSKYAAPVSDPQDGASVYRWAKSLCEDAPLDVLSQAYHVKLKRSDIRKAVAHSFPHSTHSAALRGCERGLSARHS